MKKNLRLLIAAISLKNFTLKIFPKNQLGGDYWPEPVAGMFTAV